MKEEKKELIHSAIINVMRDMKAIDKGKKNEQQGYKFRGIDDMYNALHPLFAQHGIYIASNVLESRQTERQTLRGGTLIYTIVRMQFFFIAMDGSNISSVIEGEAMDSGDKSTNKAMSTALKYAVMQMFLIPTEDLKDSDSDTYNVKPAAITEPGKEEGNPQGMLDKKKYQDMSKPKAEPKPKEEPKPVEQPVKFVPDTAPTQNPIVQEISDKLSKYTSTDKFKDDINNHLEDAVKAGCTEAELTLIRQAAKMYYDILKKGANNG